MNNNILSTSGKAFQKFISNLTEKLPKPKARFITDLLCGIIFSDDLILTHIAAKVPHPVRLTAIAKRFRRQLADSRTLLKRILFNYIQIVRRRLDVDNLFIVDLSDIAKPYAKKMENRALVRDGDKGCLVTGYCALLKSPAVISTEASLKGREVEKSIQKQIPRLGCASLGMTFSTEQGYWCMEVYALDKNGIVWPLILWPYSLQANGQLSENA